MPQLVLAQEETDSDKAEVVNEEVYIMPEFIVSAESDKGYFSANTTSVTRTNQLLKDSPLTITVINQELLEDLQILNEQDLDLVSASIDADGAATPWTLNSFSLRGFRSSYARYDLFKRALPRDGYNTGRVEIIRGANSLIYGQADPGGSVQYMPKLALFNKDQIIFGARVGSYDTKRANFDMNAAVNDKLAVRVMGTHFEEGFYQTFRRREFDGVTLETRYRLTPKTELRAHLEGVSETLNFMPLANNDGSHIDSTGVMQGLTFHPDIFEYIPDYAKQIINSNPANIANGVNTTTLSQLYSQVNKQDTGAYGGHNNERFVDGLYSIFDITHEFSENIQLKVAFNHENSDSGNDGRAIGSVQMVRYNASNAPVLDPTNEPYLVTTRTQSTGQRINTGVRALLSWEFELGKSDHTWISGYDFDKLNLESANYDLIDPTNGSYQPGLGTYTRWQDEDGGAIIWDVFQLSDGVRNPYTLPDMVSSNPYGIRGTKRDNKTDTFLNVPSWRAYKDGRTGIWTPSSTEESELITHGFWTALQSKYANGRFLSLLGARIDTYDASVAETVFKVSKPVDGPDFDDPSANGAEATFTLGGLAWLTRDLGVFANFAQSIRTPQQAQKDVFGNIPEPELGEGVEVGLRFSALKDKLTGQLVAFYIQKENDITDVIPWYELERYYPQASYPELYVENINNPGTDSVKSFTSDRPVDVTTLSQGIEFEFHYNPSRNLTFTGTYAFTETKRSDAPEAQQAAFEDNPILAVPKHRAVLTAKYTFKSGTLKGLGLGINQSWRASTDLKQLTVWDSVGDTIGLTPGFTNDTVYTVGRLKTDDEFNTRLFATYERKLGKGSKAPFLTMNFTVDNVLDDDSLTGRRDAIYFRDPRSYSLSAGLKF